MNWIFLLNYRQLKRKRKVHVQPAEIKDQCHILSVLSHQNDLNRYTFLNS